MQDESGRTLPTESDIEKLIADTNTDFPLTLVNALAALTPPEGVMIADVKGPNVEGADIIFKFPDETIFPYNNIIPILYKGKT